MTDPTQAKPMTDDEVMELLHQWSSRQGENLVVGQDWHSHDASLGRLSEKPSALDLDGLNTLVAPA